MLNNIMTFKEASVLWEVKEDTLRKRLQRRQELKLGAEYIKSGGHGL